MATKTQVLNAAKKKFGGTNLILRHNPKAPIEPERSEIRQRIKDLKALSDDFSVNAKDYNAARLTLQKAAQFVVDVNGDHPSIPQLREAVEKLNALDESRDKSSDYRTERDQLSGKIAQHRFELLRNRGWCYFHIKGEDSLDELLAFVENADSTTSMTLNA